MREGLTSRSTLCFRGVTEGIKPGGTSAPFVALWSVWLSLRVEVALSPIHLIPPGGGGEFGRHCRGFYNQPLSSRQFRPKPGSLPRWGAGGGVLGTTVSTDRNTCVICPRSSVKCYLLWPGPFCPPETERMSEPQLSSQFQWSGKVRGGANASKITINNSEMHTDYNSLSAGFPSSPVTTAMWLGGGGSHSKGCASCIEVP